MAKFKVHLTDGTMEEVEADGITDKGHEGRWIDFFYGNNNVGFHQVLRLRAV